MFKQYVISAWRTWKASKFYTLINVSGLAIGLSTAILLLLWVQNELSYDRFYQDYRQIYQVNAQIPTLDAETTYETTPGVLAQFAPSMPEIQYLVRIKADEGQALSDPVRQKVLRGNRTAFVDSNFFRVFDCPFLEGDRQHPFSSIHSVVITRRLAQRLFDQENPLGRVITYSKQDFVVTGVISSFPENSSVQLDALFPMAFYGQQFTLGGGNGSWTTIDEDMGNFSFETFVKLKPDNNPMAVGEEFSRLDRETRGKDAGVHYHLENIADLHLISADGNDGQLHKVKLFLWIDLFLLAIAAINYVNFSTARMMIRAKEVSVRKIVGADRMQLFWQFVCETTLILFASAAIAIGLIFLCMPVYNEISGKILHFSLTDFGVWKVIGLSMLGTLVAAGIYPAILLSAFQPVHLMKNYRIKGTGAAILRKGLVIFQFAISVVLIVSTLIMGRQLKYIQNKSLGFNRSYVFTVSLPDEIVGHIDAFKQVLKRNPGILQVATSNLYNFTDYNNVTGDINWPGKPATDQLIIGQTAVDKDFIPTMGMKLLEGSNFTGMPADTSHYILNETAVKVMGLKRPYIGQELTFHERKGTLIGVIQDFNFKSLKEKISPMLFYSGQWKGNILFVRTTADHVTQAIAAVKEDYARYGDGPPFSYHFLDEQFAAAYKTDQRTDKLFNLFAAIAIFISCLGLLGLVTYSSEQRTKEIGVRKVLGAGVPHIVGLMAQDFMKVVFVAIFIAMPVAWYGIHAWLNGFAYRMQLPWWPFVVASVITLLIAFLTVGSLALKTAMRNPATVLRME